MKFKKYILLIYYIYEEYESEEFIASKINYLINKPQYNKKIRSAVPAKE